MPITRIGTTSYYSSANSGSTTVNVPSGTVFVLLFITWYVSGDSNGMAGGGTASLGGESFSLIIERDYGDWGINSGALSAMWAGDAAFPIGNQTFAWDWAGSSARTEGANFMFVFLSGVDLADPVRDSDADFDDGTKSITLTTATGDMIYGGVYSYSADSDAAPAGSGQTEIVDTDINNDCSGAVGEETGGASSTTFTYDGDYSSCVAVAIKAAAGGPTQYQRAVSGSVAGPSGALARKFSGKRQQVGVLMDRLVSLAKIWREKVWGLKGEACVDQL